MIMNKGHYDLVWTNEPVMGVITRLAASKFRKNGLKVLYLAHGFHFFKGAPYFKLDILSSGKNLLLFY